MSLVDHESSFQVDFLLNVVFAAASEKLAHLPKIPLIRADKILHKITMKVRGNLFSGKYVTITFKKRDSGKTEINVLSTPKTDAAEGGLFDMGPNRKNIGIITENISDALQELPDTATIITVGDFKFIGPHCGQHLSCPQKPRALSASVPTVRNKLFRSVSRLALKSINGGLYEL